MNTARMIYRGHLPICTSPYPTGNPVFKMNNCRWTVEVYCCRHQGNSNFDIRGVWSLRLRKLDVSSGPIRVIIKGHLLSSDIVYDLFSKNLIFSTNPESKELDRITRWALVKNFGYTSERLHLHLSFEMPLAGTPGERSKF